LSAGDAGRVEELRWRTGALGCLVPVMVAATALFVVAAIRPDLVADMAEHRRGGWLAWTSAVTFGGVNVPVAALALYLGWETFRVCWRWADEVAVTATDFGLVPHRSTFIAPMPWAEIEDVRFVRLGRAPSLVVRLHGGRSRAIRGVEEGDGAAERFAQAARERAG
jgi:hypothetical protein